VKKPFSFLLALWPMAMLSLSLAEQKGRRELIQQAIKPIIEVLMGMWKIPIIQAAKLPVYAFIVPNEREGAPSGLGITLL